MKSTLAAALLFTATLSSEGFAKLIEDGSSFTGLYTVQEEACKKQVLDYVTGKTLIVGNFTFVGTPEGLKVDGTFMPIGPLTMFQHGQGISTGSYASYQSEAEFLVGTIEIFPTLNQGQKTVIENDYMVGDNGNITETTTTTIGDGQPSVTGICHFVKSK